MAVEEEDGDDDDDGEDDEPHSHTTTRTSLEQMMVMMMMMMNKKKTVSFPWRVVFLMPCWGELPEPRAVGLARAASLARSLNRRRLRSVAGCGLEARNDATALRAPATNHLALSERTRATIACVPRAGAGQLRNPVLGLASLRTPATNRRRHLSMT